MNDKELILLKMRVLYEKAYLMDLEELTIGLDYLLKDAWDKVASLYPPSIRIDA